jgi:predicted ATPase
MHLRKVTLYPVKYPTKEKYPFNLKLVNETQDVAFSTPVTFFIGENGTGKSTLLQAICLKCGVHIWEGVGRRRFEFNPYERRLYEFMDVEWISDPVPGSFFASQIFQYFAESLDEWASATPELLKYFGGSSLITKSHGQSFMSFFKARYKIKGIYFMDEPETSLSPTSQLELLKILQGFSQEGHAQFIIATHSPILLACPGATIYSFDHIPIKPIRYEETEYYRLYKDFLNHRRKYLNEP